MKLLFALLLISTTALCQTGSFRLVSDSTFGNSILYQPTKEGITYIQYQDVVIRDSVGNLVAEKKHGKAWVIKNQKKAIEILYNELQKQKAIKNETYQYNQFPRFSY